MKRTLILLLLGLVLTTTSQAQRVDTAAILLLDRMSMIIGELSSCRFQVSTAVDEHSEEYGFVKRLIDYEVVMSGPDKILVDAKGDRGHRGFWYNGELMVYYNYDEHNYSVIDVSGDLIPMMETINERYEIDFPVADLFYPTLTDDVIEHFPTIVYLGTSTVDGVECYHILADNDQLNVQVWISADATFLPKRLTVVHKEDGFTQYDGILSNWELNPIIPETMYSFHPPKGAREIFFQPAKN